jgi:prevent-host-death family protein
VSDGENGQYNGHVATQMTATELKAQILAVLDRVAAGEEVEITKHGHTIARLVPARGPSTLRGSMKAVAMTAPGVAEEAIFQTQAAWDIARDR